MSVLYYLLYSMTLTVSFSALILLVSCSVTVSCSLSLCQSLAPSQCQSFTLTVSCSAFILSVSCSVTNSLFFQLFFCQPHVSSRYQSFTLTVSCSALNLSVSCSVTQSIFYFNSTLFSSYFGRVQSHCKFLVYLVWQSQLAIDFRVQVDFQKINQNLCTRSILSVFKRILYVNNNKQKDLLFRTLVIFFPLTIV